MLWLKHYAKANSLVVFSKGRLTVLQLNGSRPSWQLLTKKRKEKKEAGRANGGFAVPSRRSKAFPHLDSTKHKAWRRALRTTSFPGTEQVAVSTRPAQQLWRRRDSLERDDAGAGPPLCCGAAAQAGLPLGSSAPAPRLGHVRFF